MYIYTFKLRFYSNIYYIFVWIIVHNLAIPGIFHYAGDKHYLSHFLIVTLWVPGQRREGKINSCGSPITYEWDTDVYQL